MLRATFGPEEKQNVQQSKISDARDRKRDSRIVHLMWHMVLTMEIEERLSASVHPNQNRNRPAHSRQEQPPYRYELDVPCDDAVNAKVFVIDDLTHSTMLLAVEY
ncbi:MAG: DUF960 family protein [Butyricicoccus sp.]